MANFGKLYLDISYNDIWKNAAAVRKDILIHKVLVFKNIITTLESQIKLMDYLYPSSNHLRILKDVDHSPLFHLFSSNEQSIPGKDNYFARWHTDDSWLEEPVDIDCIHMYHLDKEVIGGQTRWVDLEKIYTLLDSATLEFFKNIKIKKQWNADDNNDPLHRDNAEQIVYPHLRTHPETGNISIYYFGPAATAENQDDLIKYNKILFDLFEDQNNFFAHNWEKNDLVIWDNRCTAHCLMGGFSLGSRIFNKVEIGKSKPFYSEAV
jgi:alpha-ketoglutarate-dependent taurine dioxygenase